MFLTAESFAHGFGNENPKRNRNHNIMPLVLPQRAMWFCGMGMFKLSVTLFETVILQLFTLLGLKCLFLEAFVQFFDMVFLS